MKNHKNAAIATVASSTTDQQRQSDERYSVRLNGGTNAPPWLASNAQTGKMFAVPTQLRENDEVIIKGHIRDGMLDIALRPDNNQYNVVAQVNVVYPQDQSHDQITVLNVVDGNTQIIAEFKATDYLFDTSFEVSFIITSSAIRISIGDAFLQSVPLAHSTDDIRHISVRGDVKELNFRFNAY